MGIIEENAELVERGNELRKLTHENDVELKEKVKELVIFLGSDILEKRLLWEHEWVLGIYSGWSKQKLVTLECNELNDLLYAYIKSLDKQGTYWFNDDIPIGDTGWNLHMRRRGEEGMRLEYKIEDNTDFLDIMSTAFKFGVSKVKTGSLRSEYYKIRRTANEYERIIKDTERVFK